MSSRSWGMAHQNETAGGERSAWPVPLASVHADGRSPPSQFPGIPSRRYQGARQEPHTHDPGGSHPRMGVHFCTPTAVRATRSHAQAMLLPMACGSTSKGDAVAVGATGRESWSQGDAPVADGSNYCGTSPTRLRRTLCLGLSVKDPDCDSFFVHDANATHNCSHRLPVAQPERLPGASRGSVADRQRRRVPPLGLPDCPAKEVPQEAGSARSRP